MKEHLAILLFVFLLFITSISFAQEFSQITDPRDGQVYKVITIDIILEGGISVKRTWMAENLKFESEESYCYNDEYAYCEAYGRLYVFDAAVKACPTGWHIPSMSEWSLLFNTFGGIKKAGLALQKDGESGLNLSLGGFGDPGNIFKNVGLSGNYWNSQKRSSKTAGLISISKDSKEIYQSLIGNWHRNSCRCVKDYK